MAIKDLPEDFAGFERLLADYEREHFAFDPGGRRVADSTLDLLTPFAPNSYAPKWAVKRFAYSLMDESHCSSRSAIRSRRGSSGRSSSER